MSKTNLFHSYNSYNSQKKEEEISIDDLTELQIAEYKEAFQILDKHGEGTISSNELGTIIRSLGLNPLDEDLKEIIDSFDNEINKNLIYFNSFLVIMAKRKNDIDKEEDLIDAFRVFDKENNGKISARELRYVMMSSGEDLNENDIEEMIREASTENDDFIDYYKFVKLMLS